MNGKLTGAFALLEKRSARLRSRSADDFFGGPLFGLLPRIRPFGTSLLATTPCRPGPIRSVSYPAVATRRACHAAKASSSFISRLQT